MKTKFEDGKFTLDINEMVDLMSAESKAELIRYLCADSTLQQAVVDSVVTGSFFADEPGGYWSLGEYDIAAMREKLLPLMGEVAREAVKREMTLRKNAEASDQRAKDWAWKLWHAWPDGHWDKRPEHPEFRYVTATDADVDAALEAKS